MAWESQRGPMAIDPETRDVVQNIYIRRVEKVGGVPVNVIIDTIKDVKDPVLARTEEVKFIFSARSRACEDPARLRSGSPPSRGRTEAHCAWGAYFTRLRRQRPQFRDHWAIQRWRQPPHTDSIAAPRKTQFARSMKRGDVLAGIAGAFERFEPELIVALAVLLEQDMHDALDFLSVRAAIASSSRAT